jgi:hypothetical protein
MELLMDMIIPAHYFGELNYRGSATSWIYVCSEPNEGIVLQMGKFIETSEAKYIGMCWEKTRSGKQLLIVFMVFKSAHSENSLKTRYGFSGGILLAKSRRSVALSLVVQWMKGNFFLDGKLKPANQTFQQVRLEGYMMRGREHDKDFLDSVWINEND